MRRAAQPLDNLDTYFHLRFGHEFLTGAWSLRHPGSVSTFATADWVPTQWLPQVVMAQVEEWFGLPGVAWLSGLLFLSLALAVYVACRRQAEPLVAAIVVSLTLVACTPGMSMRPQQISYLLVVVTTAAWLRARETGRAPWLLVPLTWVWTMCHGMWPRRASSSGSWRWPGWPWTGSTRAGAAADARRAAALGGRGAARPRSARGCSGPCCR